MATGVWWQRPRLRTDEDEERERQAPWLELVYDLVLVVVVAELAARLKGDLSWRDVARFGLLFVPVWWVWMGATLYNDRFATDDVGQRLITFLELLPVAGLALTVGQATADRGRGFALSYAAARLIAIALWVRARRSDPVARPLTARLAAGSGLALLPWLLSLAVPEPARFGLWALGLAVDLLTPVATVGVQARLPRLSASHLPERYRLFTVVVLGEAVNGAVRAVAEVEHLPLAAAVAGVSGLALAFGLGWAAFDGALGRPGRSGWRGTAEGYLLLPLTAALTALGRGVADAVAHAGEGLAASTRWLLCGAAAAALVSLGALDLLLDPDRLAASTPRRDAATRFGAAALAQAVGLVGSGLAAPGLLGPLALLGLGQALVGLLPRPDTVRPLARDTQT